MKRLPHILFFLLICISPAFSQSEFKQEWAFGVNGGMTFSSINFSPTVYQKSLDQFVGGVSARYITEKYFGLQAELNLSQRGWEESKDSIPEHRYTKSLLYAELPVLTHIYFNMGSRIRMVFNLGPQISYLLSERLLERNIVLDPGTKIDNIPIQYYTDVQNKFDWGIVGGGGFELLTGIGSFVLEGRYFFGLSDIYNNAQKDYYATSSNQVIYAKMTYFFRL